MVLAAAALILFLILAGPALWNGYPLLQYDTGGYLARWHEGYLVPSRSTVYGVFLHLGENSDFWINVALQSAAATYVLLLTQRLLGIHSVPLRLASGLAVCLTSALPWLASQLLTDIFVGLAVLSVFLLAVRHHHLTWPERLTLSAITMFAAASHSATFGLLVGLCVSGWLVRPLIRPHLSASGLAAASMAALAGAALLLATNFALSGKLAWTPGGYGILFGRLLENGTVKPYLDKTCPRTAYALCPYRATLPDTADDFLWGHSVFDKLGRFAGLGDEMRAIVLDAAAKDPLKQATEALRASARQLTLVATGEGMHNRLWHTYGTIERFVPAQVKPMRSARQQQGGLHLETVNALHVPVAYLSMAGILAMIAGAFWKRRVDTTTLLAGTAALALLGNAVLCGALSGPHPRYGARLVWLSTFVLAIALAQWLVRRWSQSDPDFTAVAPETP
ncbi:MAG: hypothetical protein EPO23_04080 [Xanthobacteraceae bacterium]|nr:MAG: hypothetical protein EPO23_04080 [Xanthobacteraceae bacterium]